MRYATTNLKYWLAMVLVLLGTGSQALLAQAADISVLSASALKPALTELAEAFQRKTGHVVKLSFATAGEVHKRVLAGEATDLVIATDVATEQLAAQGFVRPDTRTIIARVGVGIGIRKGAPIPAISDTDALKRTLLSTQSVTYPDPARGGASGIHFAQVIERLGVSQALAHKTVLGEKPEYVCAMVAKGDVDLCVHQISEILPVKGVTLVGPLPSDVQKVTTFTIALSAETREVKAARAFHQFVTHSSVKTKFAKAGLAYQQASPDVF